jgi:prevent-host-death family protein
MSISKFKATCLAVLEKVRRTGRPVRITKFGKPIAEVVPPARSKRPQNWIGALKNTGKIKGNIVNSVIKKEDWEAFEK